MRSRIVVAGLALAAVAVVSIAASDSTWVLRLRHEIQSRLKRLSAVATVSVGELEPFPMFLNPDDSGVTPTLRAHGIWESVETYWFMRSLRPGDVLVDVGANVGYYTLIGARLVGETGRVYAFEPDPTAFALLRKNVRLNGLDNVVLEQKAVSNQAGSIELFINPVNQGDHRIYQPEGERRQTLRIEAVSLDGYFDGVEDDVQFVKIDTQGAEGLILEGMMDLVRRSGDVVMAIEYSPFHLAGLGSTAEDMLERIATLGLAMFPIGDGSGGIRPLQPITAEELLARFSPDVRDFTNLILMKQRGR